MKLSTPGHISGVQSATLQATFWPPVFEVKFDSEDWNVMTNWHRLFGLALTDLLTGTNYAVELEKDLSTQQQFLDVLIVQQSGEGLPRVPLPDGFDNLAKYNLLTYKSLQEPLNCWAIGELIGHYISYRKEVSPNLNQLLPEEDFRLYAVATHYPAKLATQVTLQEVAAGIYELNCGCYHIRVLVTGQFPPTPDNAFWQLFSAKASQVWYGLIINLNDRT